MFIQDPMFLGCWSYVGKQDGVQLIQLSKFASCFTKRTISHEILHSLGFYHEHSRPDRDKYITINESCVQHDSLKNFKIQQNSLTYGTDYDAKSILHYKANAASNGNCKTIISKVSMNRSIF